MDLDGGECLRVFCLCVNSVRPRDAPSAWADPLRTFPSKFVIVRSAVPDSPGRPMVVGRRDQQFSLEGGKRASKPVEAPERAIVRPGRLDFRGLPRLLYAGLGRR